MKPQSYEIGTVDGHARNDDGNVVLVRTSICGQHIPLPIVLKSFLEQKGIFNTMTEYLQSLSNDTSGKVLNFVQDELWQKLKAPFADKIVFLINLEFDDYEPDNPLGSHHGDHSLGGLYASLPCLPPELFSVLDNMFLVCIFESKYRKIFGNDAVFYPAIADLTSLEEEGISINVDGVIYQVYFCFSVMVGDNLGNNGIMGIIEGFRGNYYCRTCTLHRDVAAHHCGPVRDGKLRNVENYNDDVATNYATQTGLKEAWNRVPSYHSTVNKYVEPMHDILGGALKYDVCSILWYFIAVRNYFDITTLSERIDGFDYGPGEQGNKPPTSNFSLDKLQFCTINLSASEMLCLTRNLGQMIGDLVPEDSNVWKMYLTLREIVEFVT